MKISLIIVTRNRPQDLRRLVHAMNRGSLRENLEILIIDQSRRGLLSKEVQSFSNNIHTVRYFHRIGKGKSNGLNQALKYASGEMVFFTDDDCLPHRRWLEEGVRIFSSYRNVTAVFGATHPFGENNKLICPSTFSNKQSNEHIIRSIYMHSADVGLGNNMAIRKSFFIDHGGFREWLGPGSIGSNAEDAELILRLYVLEKTMVYNPKMIVFHNKWQTQIENYWQNVSYVCGEVACYAYYALQGYELARTVALHSVIQVISDIKTSFKNLFLLKKSSFNQLFYALIMLTSCSRGLCVAVGAKIFANPDKGPHVS